MHASHSTQCKCFADCTWQFHGVGALPWTNRSQGRHERRCVTNFYHQSRACEGVGIEHMHHLCSPSAWLLGCTQSTRCGRQVIRPALSFDWTACQNQRACTSTCWLGEGKRVTERNCMLSAAFDWGVC